MATHGVFVAVDFSLRSDAVAHGKLQVKRPSLSALC